MLRCLKGEPHGHFCSSLTHAVSFFLLQSGQTAHSPIGTLLLHQLRSQLGGVGAHVHAQGVPHLPSGDPLYQVRKYGLVMKIHHRFAPKADLQFENRFNKTHMKMKFTTTVHTHVHTRVHTVTESGEWSVTPTATTAPI